MPLPHTGQSWPEVHPIKAVPLARSLGAELPNPQGLSQTPFTQLHPVL
jgi:hypothetical protein